MPQHVQGLMLGLTAQARILLYNRKHLLTKQKGLLQFGKVKIGADTSFSFRVSKAV